MTVFTLWHSASLAHAFLSTVDYLAKTLEIRLGKGPVEDAKVGDIFFFNNTPDLGGQFYRKITYLETYASLQHLLDELTSADWDGLLPVRDGCPPVRKEDALSAFSAMYPAKAVSAHGLLLFDMEPIEVPGRALT